MSNDPPTEDHDQPEPDLKGLRQITDAQILELDSLDIRLKKDLQGILQYKSITYIVILEFLLTLSTDVSIVNSVQMRRAKFFVP